MNNISYGDFKNICRMCMLNCDIKFARDNVISDVFYKLTDIHFQSNDELPQQICRKCFEKINEIHEFAFQCKQTHSRLLQCLNNFKNPRIKEEPDISEEIYKPFKIEEIIIDEHNIDSFKEEVISSVSEYDIDELNIKQDKNNDCEEIPGTSDDININNSKDDLLEQNIPNFEVENKEESNDNVNQNDSNEDTYSSDISDISHADSTENNEEISKKTKEKHKCEECQKSFSNSYRLKRHMRMHSGERPYKCDQCSRMFSQSNHLKDHMHIHSAELPFKCEQCSKSFSRSSNFKSHMRTHSGERPFKCKQCPKSFSLSSSLRIHMRKHSGERPYQCERCSKFFTQFNHLNDHMRIHSGERPYKCELCSKTFSQSSTLNKHMRTHK